MHLIVLFVAIVISVGHGAVPRGFILDVSPECGVSGDANANITVTSDLYVTIIAHCHGENMTETLGGSKVRRVISALYATSPGFPDGNCYFSRASATSQVYTLDIDMFWSPIAGSPAVQKETKRITCSLGGYAKEEKTITKEDSPFAPEDLTQMKGVNDQDDAVTLAVQDVLGRELTGTIPLGKSVQLSATIDGAGGMMGVVPVTCEAVSAEDPTKTYKVISGGCGDGIVFTKDQGFTTAGLTSVSPFFKMFDIETSTTDVIFRCNFTACSAACDGDSCQGNSRRKRSGEIMDDTARSDVDRSAILEVSSPMFRLSRTPPNRKSSLDVIQLIVDNLRERFYVAMAILGTLVGVSLLVSLYLCLRPPRSSVAGDCECSKSCKCTRPCNCPENQCKCPENRCQCLENRCTCPENRCTCPENVPFL